MDAPQYGEWRKEVVNDDDLDNCPAEAPEDPFLADEEWADRIWMLFPNHDALYAFMSAMAQVAREYPVS
jgi:hypothetical protein